MKIKIKDNFKGVKVRKIFAILVLFLIFTANVFSATVTHPASNITSGTFSAGDFAFQNNVGILMSSPSGVSVNAVLGGSLTTGTYYFKIVASDGLGTTVGSSEVSCIVDGITTNRCSLSWTAVIGASSYRIYKGTSSNGQDKYQTSTTNSYNYDTDIGATLGSVPTVTTAYVNKLAANGNNWILGGNVGIGTTGPSTALHILKDPMGISPYANIIVEPTSNDKNSGISLKTTYTDTDRNWGIYAGSGGAPNTANFRIVDITAGNADRLNIDPLGNVGIGTTTPGQKLHVIGSVSSDDALVRAEASNPAIDTQFEVARFLAQSTGVMVDGFGGSIQLHIKDGDSSTGVAAINWERDGADNSGALGFWTRGTTGWNKNLIITSTGEVGIGVPNPGEKLEVSGNIKSSNLGGTGDRCVYADANGVLKSTTSACGSGSGTITAVGSMTSGAAFADFTATGDWLGLGSGAGRIEFDDQATDEVNILDANVGIGTTTPGTYKLYVSGTGYFSSTLTGASTITAVDDIYAQGSDFYDNLGDVHLSGEDSVYIKMDYNNDDSDTRAIIFGKNTGLGTTPSATNELMRITEAGSVGIGTTTPAHRLEVAGSMNISGDLNVSNNLTFKKYSTCNLETLSNGEVVCGVDDTSSIDTNDLDIANRTMLQNETIIRNWNTTWVANVMQNFSIVRDYNRTWVANAIQNNTILRNKTDINVTRAYFNWTLVYGNLTVKENLTLPKYPNCNLETLFNGEVVCGVDDTGGGGLWTESGNNIYRDIGNVGIGTANPLVKLSVNGTTGFDILNVSNGTVIGLYVNKYSNVGIGTMNPVHKLEVAGSMNISGDLNVSGSMKVKGDLNVSGNLNVSRGLTVMMGNVGIGTNSPGARLTINQTGAGLSLNVSNLLFVNDTNVGIGTAKPTSLLHVVGGALNASGGLIMQVYDGTPPGVQQGQMWLDPIP